MLKGRAWTLATHLIINYKTGHLRCDAHSMLPFFFFFSGKLEVHSFSVIKFKKKCNSPDVLSQPFFKTNNVLVLKCISDLVSRAGCEIRLYRFLIVNTCCLVILRSMDLFAIGEARIAVQDRHMTPESRFRSFKCNGSSS